MITGEVLILRPSPRKTPKGWDYRILKHVSKLLKESSYLKVLPGKEPALLLK